MSVLAHATRRATAARSASRGREAAILRRAACVSAGVVAGVLAVALAVRVTGAEAARDRLGLTFPGLPHTAGAALDVFIANARLLGVTLVGAAVAQLTRPGPEARAHERLLSRAPVALCDVVLGAGCLLQVALVGTALGAYGGRTLASILPHGPVELAGFAVGLALYLEVRRRPLPWRPALRLAVVAVVLLAVAAGLEVFTGA